MSLVADAALAADLVREAGQLAAEMRGDHDGAIPYYERSLELARVKGLVWPAGWAWAWVAR